MLKFVPEEPALIIDSRGVRNLVIPDLHLGFEKALSARGVRIPSQTPKLLNRIERLIDEYSPGCLIFLGDVKHGTARIERQEWLEVPQFFQELAGRVSEVHVIPGNHDGNLKDLLPREVALHPSSGLLLSHNGETVSLFHGHTWPPKEAFTSQVLVMAHHHFTLELRDSMGYRFVEPVWVMARWDRKRVAKAYLNYLGLKDVKKPLTAFQRRFGLRLDRPRIIVMPTFNPLLGGAPINAPWDGEQIGPIFRHGVIRPSDVEIHLLDGTFLGRVSTLLARRDKPIRCA
jgi:hypothetical protein